MTVTHPPLARLLVCHTCGDPSLGWKVDRRAWKHRRHARGPRPFAVSALAAAMGIDPTAWDFKGRLATSLGLDPSWVRRELQDGGGLTARTADHWAARAGLHADIVWPGWWDDPGATELLDGEDDPPLSEVEAVSPERLVWLRMQHALRGAAA